MTDPKEDSEVREVKTEGGPKVFIIEKPGKRTIEELKQTASQILKAYRKRDK